MSYCTACGAPRLTGGAFCTSCGAPQAPVTTAPPQAVGAPAPTPAFSTVSAPVSLPPAAPSQPFAPAKKGSVLPLVLIVLGVLGLIAVAGIGGVVYLGYKVKQKVTSVAEAVTHPAPSPGGNNAQPHPQDDASNVSGLLGNLSNLLGNSNQADDGIPTIMPDDPVTPCSVAPLPSQSAARIPLQQGTVVTTAWGLKNGDIEDRESVSSTDSSSVSLQAPGSKWKDDYGTDRHADDTTPAVCNADLASSDTYITVEGAKVPRIIHGATRLRLSSKSFNELKSSGKTTLRYLDTWDANGGIKLTYEGGPLTRVEPQDVAYPMIVNDQRVTLPAIHLAGIMASVGKDPRPKEWLPTHSEADVYIIDDPLDPLVLLWKLKDPVLHAGKFRVETVKIEYPVAKPVNLVEKQLTEQKRAVTYGIYFDFNKDTIKPESEPVLKEIVQAMTDNPDWKLTVEGHTDNIGGDTYNLDLSKRRAAAVKEALVTRYNIAPDRLSTNGYGASRPVETNDTLEGRARNRRVELTRE
jgi:outer membrane protein OmpA-like peptidoglycan-associated protein